MARKMTLWRLLEHDEDRVEKEVMNLVEEISYSNHEHPLDELRQGMNYLFGFEFPASKKGRQKAYSCARSIYHEAKLKEILEEEKKVDLSRPLKEMPALLIDFGEKRYYLHPIVHGNNKKWMGDKELLEESCLRYYFGGSRLFYEQNLEYRIPMLRETGENFKDHDILSAKDLAKSAGVALLSLPLMPVLKRYSRTFGALSRFAKDLRYAQLSSSVVDAVELPSAIYTDYLSEKGGYQERVNNARSRLMAEKMSNCPSNEIHAVFGTGHLEQIATFITKIEKIKHPSLKPTIRWLDGYKALTL